MSAAVALRYSSSSTPTTIDGSRPSTVAPTARQSTLCSTPASAKAPLPSVIRLMITEMKATDAISRPVASPTTTIPSAKPVTVWM